jgi:hypothetical protein
MQQPLVLPPSIKRVVWIGYLTHVREFVEACVACLNENKIPTDLWVAKEWPNQVALRDPSVLYIITRGLELSKAGCLPLYYIIHQVEQCGCAALQNHSSIYVMALKKALRVWEYSRTNMVYMRSVLKLQNVSLLEFAYHPGLEFHNLTECPATDILFLGQPCQRRVQLLLLFRAAGLNVRSEFNVFGREKAKLIAGSKLVLNMHYYTNPSILETERLGLLLANKKCVVSESSSEVDRDQNYSQGVVFESDPNELVKRCQELLACDELRKNVEQQGKTSQNWPDTLIKKFAHVV